MRFGLYRFAHRRDDRCRHVSDGTRWRTFVRNSLHGRHPPIFVHGPRSALELRHSAMMEHPRSRTAVPAWPRLLGHAAPKTSVGPRLLLARAAARCFLER